MRRPPWWLLGLLALCGLGIALLAVAVLHRPSTPRGPRGRPGVSVTATPTPTMSAHPKPSGQRPTATATNTFLVSSAPSAHPTATVTKTRPVVVRTTKTARPSKKPTHTPSPTPDPVASCLNNLLHLKSCHR